MYMSSAISFQFKTNTAVTFHRYARGTQALCKHRTGTLAGKQDALCSTENTTKCSSDQCFTPGQCDLLCSSGVIYFSNMIILVQFTSPYIFVRTD